MAQPNILIVDDEIIIARDLETRLKGMGYAVPAIASSGVEAIRLAAEIEPDLILMDIVLKGQLDGIDTATEIRRGRDIPIIYLTAYTDKRTLERAKLTEPFGYIVKPFAERELQANIEMALYKHRADRRLRKIEQWFTAAISEVGDAVVAADPDGRITVFNPAAEAITQWTREQAIGRKLDDVLRLVNRENGRPITLQDVDEGPMIRLAGETLLVDRSERTIPVDNATSRIRNEVNEPVGTISVFRDPTGKRNGLLMALNADVSLAAAQAATLRAMLQFCVESMVRNVNAALARVWTLNTVGDMLLLQASAGLSTSLDGAQSRVPVGSHRIGLVAQLRHAYMTNDLADDPLIPDADWMIREGLVSLAGFPLIVDDRLIGVMTIFCRHPLPEVIAESLSTVAHAIAVGVERKRLEEQLRQSQKMEAIGQLAGGIAHDFNNLLTIISGYSQILLGREDIDEDVRNLVMQIGAAGDRAASLTRQLLAFSRKQVLDPRILDLNALVSDIERMLRRLIGEGIVLETSLAPELPSMLADPGQIEQVIMNLAVNAADAMPEGGRLTLETSVVELDATFATTYPTAKPGCYILLAVTDTGCGMSSETIAHIFEPFFTTKGPGVGTGLGLATVYGIVRQSGGYIGVYSELGIGSTFKIYLPCADGALAGKTQNHQTMRRGSETILLVEDENPVRALTRYVLQECGYTVLDAGDADEALEIAERHGDIIHLILTDVVLPGGGGRVIVEQLADARPGIKVLYMSGYTDDAVIRHGVLRAEAAFIQKPFTPVSLAAKVREVLDQ